MSRFWILFFIYTFVQGISPGPVAFNGITLLLTPRSISPQILPWSIVFFSVTVFMKVPNGLHKSNMKSGAFHIIKREIPSIWMSQRCLWGHLDFSFCLSLIILLPQSSRPLLSLPVKYVLKPASFSIWSKSSQNHSCHLSCWTMTASWPVCLMFP